MRPVLELNPQLLPQQQTPEPRAVDEQVTADAPVVVKVDRTDKAGLGVLLDSVDLALESFDAEALRAKVVGEGANLGMTQRGRIEFAVRGGRLNTDFIDNAAGVVTWIGFKRSQVRFTKGAELIRDYASSKGVKRKFCTHCGTRLAFESSHGNWADEVHLPLALFVTPVDRAPAVNSFPEERPAWAPLHEFADG